MTDQPDAARSLRAQQFALARHVRDPSAHPPPPGIENRRLAVYRDLFCNSIEGLLAGNFPVIRKTLGDGAWQSLVQRFYADHRCRTPLFTRIGRELVDYLEQRIETDTSLPPWLPELAHYEWIELALQISQARGDDIPCDADGDLLDGRPLLSPLAWPLLYTWPVHRIGPDHLPDTLPAEPSCLLLQRDADGTVRFQQLSALTFRLLQRLQQQPELDGRSQLQTLALEAASEADDAFIAQGLTMLQQLRANTVILGTRRDE